MSCDHELANEWACCSGKNASYITKHVITAQHSTRKHLAKVRLHPHHTREIWKRSFISIVRPTVCINPVWKLSSSNRRNLKTLAFCLSKDTKHFKNGAFWIHWSHNNHERDFPDRIFLNTTPQWPVQQYCCIFKFLWCSVERNIWCIFRVKALL